MLRKVSSLVAAKLAIIAMFAAVSFAQNAPVSGRVELKKADGTVVPVEGATVEVFRSDTKGSGPADKSDKRGNFSFAGLPLGGTYIIAVSAPGASPIFQPGIKPGMENLRFSLSEGDGRRLTAEEVREAALLASSPEGGRLSEEAKKAQAEFEKARKEIDAKNAKIQDENQIIGASLKEGNEAYSAKNYDLAITKYEAGIAANPNFVGSAPVLMNNRGAALRSRAIATYNANVRNTDASAKGAAYASVKADLGAAAESYSKAFSMIEAAPASETSDPKIKETRMNALIGATESFRLMAQTEQVDGEKLEFAKTVIPQYLQAETDVAKKQQAQMILADLYRVTGDADNAIAEYKKVIEASPENLDALVGLGLSLVNAGYMDMENSKSSNDKALEQTGKNKLQEGANYLQKFASAAPDTHKYKDDAVATVQMLKDEQKIAPQKVAAPARRRN